MSRERQPAAFETMLRSTVLLALLWPALLTRISYAADEASISLPRCADDLVTIRYSTAPSPVAFEKNTFSLVDSFGGSVGASVGRTQRYWYLIVLSTTLPPPAAVGRPRPPPPSTAVHRPRSAGCHPVTLATLDAHVSRWSQRYQSPRSAMERRVVRTPPNGESKISQHHGRPWPAVR